VEEEELDLMVETLERVLDRVAALRR